MLVLAGKCSEYRGLKEVIVAGKKNKVNDEGVSDMTFLHLKRRTNPAALLPAFFLVMLLTVSSAVHAVEIKEKKPTREMSAITSLTVTFITKQHYDRRPFDAKLSEAVFDHYLKTLDPGKMFFTKSDVEKFSVNSRNLNKLLPYGKVDFAFDAYNLMLRRMKDYVEYSSSLIDKGFDFTVDETFEYDRSKADWPASEEELHELWRKKIKNDILTLALMDRSMDAEAGKTPATTSSSAASGSAGKAESSGSGSQGQTGSSPSASSAPGVGIAEQQPQKPQQPTVHSSWARKTPGERVKKRLEQILRNYNDLELVEVLELFLSSFAQVYDPHSAYMSPRTGEDFNMGMSLSLVGIGAVLTSEDGYTKVVEIVPGGPADKEGQLKAEDRIIAVAQENADPVDVIDMPLQKVVDMIRGELGTKVTLTVLDATKGLQSIPKRIEIIRNKVMLKEAEAKGVVREVKLPDGSMKKIGVVTLPSFYMDFDAARRGDPDFKSSTRDVNKILEHFLAEKVDGVIIDLRSNGGGSLWEAIALTGLFIPSGPVVQVKDKIEIQVKEDEDGGYIAYGGPLLVMINRLSASASEIFAAAIKDYERGVLVGDSKTHGKGTVQVVSDLDRYMPFHSGEVFPAGSIKLTNAKFYRINGESTQLKGVVPDIAFPSFTDSMEIGEEKLEHALPWDSIRSAEYQKYPGGLPSLIPRLKANSEKRMAASADFKTLKLDIDTFNKIRDKKSISLNLEKRWQEYLDEKNLQEEQEKLMRLGDSRSASAGTSSREKKSEVKDLYLEESLNIMADLISLSAGEQAKQAAQAGN